MDEMGKMMDRHGAELVFDRVCVTYPNGFTAVKDADLQVFGGEIAALLGASGSGKSTLLRAVAGLERVSAGRILIDGCDMARIPTHLRNVGMVFQDGQLFPHRNVFQNVAYGLEMAGLKRAEIKRQVTGLLQLVGMGEYAARSVTTLSGGQAQRIALARTLAAKPKIILFDEPLSALDKDFRAGLGKQLRKILKDTGTTALFVTHDREEAKLVADRIVMMQEIQKRVSP
ncbi:ABC transporter ATP-binding protein [Arcanobacterium hippocoleae]